MGVTRNVQAEQGFVPYGGLFFCDKKYHLHRLIKAVGRYEIDVGSSTEDTDGNWKGLALYNELITACSPGGADYTGRKPKGRLPSKPARENQKKLKVLEEFFICPPAR